MGEIRVNTEPNEVRIPFDEYKELLMKSLRIDLICDMIETGDFITKKDLLFVLGMKQKENENV